MYNISREELSGYLAKNMTNREIAAVTGMSRSTVNYKISGYGMNNEQRFHKRPTYKFGRIDSPDKAYALGFIACDAAISNSITEISIQKSDKEVCDFIAQLVDANVFVDDTLDKKAKRYPRARMEKKILDINTYIGSGKKKDRHLPIVREELSRYILLGAFDADGCLTWGRRKDKDRIWQKVSFTTQLNIAVCIQNILVKELAIPTVVRPKSGCDCYVLEFSRREDVLKFLDYIYQDNFVVLKRKYLKYKALRLELEENGEGAEKQ